MALDQWVREDVNPVIETSLWAFSETNIVGIDDKAVLQAAKYIDEKLRSEAYTPRTWRTQDLHLLPPDGILVDEHQDTANPTAKFCLDWIFLISSLNFSFWSDKGELERYGVKWRDGWGKDTYSIFTGYWSLVAALNRAIEEGIKITDPAFYASETKCPDSVLVHVFRSEPGREEMPLLKERIQVMRQVGNILCKSYDSSFLGFIRASQRQQRRGTALDMVKKVAETFPAFRDEVVLHGRKVYLWKRTQILVAEAWAAFYPPSPEDPHPLFPTPCGPQIHQLTMFADYRVPQILHHLSILTYPPSLVRKLEDGAYFAPGSPEELSIRTAGIVAVERLRAQMMHLGSGKGGEPVSSVLIDFYLWDLAKDVEAGATVDEGVKTTEVVPAHRTRSIWY